MDRRKRKSLLKLIIMNKYITFRGYSIKTAVLLIRIGKKHCNKWYERLCVHFHDFAFCYCFLSIISTNHISNIQYLMRELLQMHNYKTCLFYNTHSTCAWCQIIMLIYYKCVQTKLFPLNYLVLEPPLDVVSRYSNIIIISAAVVVWYIRTTSKHVG